MDLLPRPGNYSCLSPATTSGSKLQLHAWNGRHLGFSYQLFQTILQAEDLMFRKGLEVLFHYPSCPL